jgi:hypothetical protein
MFTADCLIHHPSYAIVFNFTVPLMVKAWNIKAVWLFVCLGIP